MTITIQSKLPADVALLLNGGSASEAARLGQQRSATEQQQNNSVTKSRRMHHHELPDDFLSSVLPTARPIRCPVKGKESKKWQAVTFHQGPASNSITLLWSSRELYETRDEALEVAVLKAERSEVADYLHQQGIVSIPIDAPVSEPILPRANQQPPY
jgi:hypothetical protein